MGTLYPIDHPTAEEVRAGLVAREKGPAEESEGFTEPNPHGGEQSPASAGSDGSEPEDTRRLRKIAERHVRNPGPILSGDWLGAWNNWIAPFHFCPRCNKSLNWRQDEDVFDRPWIIANCCNVHHSAALHWEYVSASGTTEKEG